MDLKFSLVVAPGSKKAKCINRYFLGSSKVESEFESDKSTGLSMSRLSSVITLNPLVIKPSLTKDPNTQYRPKVLYLLELLMSFILEMHNYLS